jgi:hypothetical protein
LFKYDNKLVGCLFGISVLQLGSVELKIEILADSGHHEFGSLSGFSVVDKAQKLDLDWHIRRNSDGTVTEPAQQPVILCVEALNRKVIGHKVPAHVRRQISVRIINSVGMVETEVVTQLVHLDSKVLDPVIVHN